MRWLGGLFLFLYSSFLGRRLWSYLYCRKTWIWIWSFVIQNNRVIYQVQVLCLHFHYNATTNTQYANTLHLNHNIGPQCVRKYICECEQ